MTFFEIFVSVIASAGGLGAILWISIKSVSKYLVEDLNKKYQLQLDKQLEEYKKTLDIEKSVHNSMLSNKVYITKSKFDVELAVYRDLSRLFMVMTKSCSFLFTEDNYYYDGKRSQEFWVKKSLDAIRAVDEAQNILYQNAAFIPESLYLQYEQVLQKCQDIVLALEPLAHNAFGSTEAEEKKKYVDLQKLCAKDILEDYDRLCKQLRDYLNRLDVL